MQQRCPIQNCGRMFENQLTMLEHVKRRHPQQQQKIREQTTNQMLEKQNRITEEMNKLPKMQKVIQMSKQKKPLEFHRRSSSKKKIELSGMMENSHSKISEIVAESRQMLDENSSSRKLLKRPSLSKKPSEQQDIKLPSLGQSKINKLKLESLKSDLNSSTVTRQSQVQKLSIKNESLLQKESQSAMYSTAPNFTHQMTKKIDLLKSRGKKEGEISNRSSSKDIKQGEKSEAGALLLKKRLSSQTMETLIQSEKTLEVASKPSLQRPSVKKLLQRSTKKDNASSILTTSQELTQSTFIQPQQVAQQKKQFTFAAKKRPLSKQDQRFTKKQRSPVASPLIQPNLKSVLLDEFNWQERTVTIRSKQIEKLVIPSDSEVEYLYVTGCGVKLIELNECFSLISLTLTNNCISSFSFLEQTINGGYENLESLYMDKNDVVSLDTLPSYLQLKKLSLAFNKIEGLDKMLKVMVKFPMLQELDLSFCPVRKSTNYKLAVLAACKGLKKLDGMVVTRLDRQMASEYCKMYFDYLHIIPLSSSPLSQDKFRPSTAVSINYQQQFDQQSDHLTQQMTEEQLIKEIEILQKMIRNTKDQFEIIKEENNALEEEIQSYEGELINGEQKEEEFNPKVYRKLLKEVQELQMLNFLQYASEKQLQDIISRKITEKGLNMELLTAG